MLNNYSWNLSSSREREYLEHGGAHYSKNWTKAKQQEYNKWYYEQHKDKYAELNAMRQKENQENNQYHTNKRKSNELWNKDVTYSYDDMGRRWESHPHGSKASDYNNEAKKHESLRDSYRSRRKELDKEISSDKRSVKSHAQFAVYKVSEASKSTIDKGKKAISNLFG